jgi:RNA polymerase sigma factor (sigma-70 family)
VLRHVHDAEDAFQATFLVLARKAASVVRRESLACWLYQVAYHAALDANAAGARRRATERQVSDMPHPAVAPAEPQDWRPLLDRELSRLPEKYRAAVVLCDLEGRPRREAAQLLGIKEGTLSSRLAAARALLAKRLAGCGLALSAGALAAALAPGTAAAQVSASLVGSTARAAALVAAGQLAAVSPPAAALMRGVMKAMLLKKLRVGIGAVVLTVALATLGIAYQAGGGAGAAQAAAPDKPKSELEALRKENELLKLNLQVVLEKVQAQETELRDLRGKVAAAQAPAGPWKLSVIQSDLRFANPLTYPAYVDPVGATRWAQFYSVDNPLTNNVYWNYNALTPYVTLSAQRDPFTDAAQAAECALKALREARDEQAQRRAMESLEKAMKKLKEHVK